MDECPQLLSTSMDPEGIRGFSTTDAGGNLSRVLTRSVDREAKPGGVNFRDGTSSWHGDCRPRDVPLLGGCCGQIRGFQREQAEGTASADRCSFMMAWIWHLCQGFSVPISPNWQVYFPLSSDHPNRRPASGRGPLGRPCINLAQDASASSSRRLKFNWRCTFTLAAPAPLFSFFFFFFSFLANGDLNNTRVAIGPPNWSSIGVGVSNVRFVIGFCGVVGRFGVLGFDLIVTWIDLAACQLELK